MDIARWFLGEPALAPRVISIGGRLGYEDAGNTPNTQVVFLDLRESAADFRNARLAAVEGGPEPSGAIRWTTTAARTSASSCSARTGTCSCPTTRRSKRTIGKASR